MLVEISFIVVTLLLYLYYKLTKNKNHWRDRNVPSTKFRFLWGDDGMGGEKSIHEIAKEEYFKHPGERFYGGWSMFGVPYLMIRNDFELIRAIWIKDFDHFNQTRSAEFAEKIWPASKEEKMMLNTIQSMHGEAWKDIRSTFSPVFTSGKLKQMLPLLQEVGDKIEKHIKEITKTSEDGNIELKDLMGKFSMDALASCAFGVDSGSFTHKDSDSEFVKQAKIVFDFGSLKLFISIVVSFFTPKIVKQFFHALGFKRFATWSNLDANIFFQRVVEASIKQRKESKTRRNDLVDLMIDATEGKLDGTEDSETVENTKENLDKKRKDFDYAQVISTATLLLVAGYDTTGTSMSWILYELALNPDCQETLLEEISNAKDATGLTYDVIQSLPYLDAVIHETLRRHPAVSALERPCVKDYKLPNSDIVLKKGDWVRVNNMGICFDPEIYPNPEEWNPDNFSKENRATRNPYSFMAFSLGPRNCLAMRFAFFEMKVAVSHILMQFKLEATSKTNRNPKIDPKAILGGAKDGLWIKFVER